MSLRSTNDLNEALKRITALETVQHKHATALSHMGKMHDELETIKDKEAELCEIVLRLLSGQTLSPAQASVVAKEKSNTTKV
jgi:hypothetical protein